jgi:hypothetical protein
MEAVKPGAGGCFFRGRFTVIFGEPETARFLAMVERIKRMQQVKLKRTRRAKQKARALLRKMREC